MLRAESVSFDYGGAPVLEAVSLALRAGELVGLVGPNGAGKSSLLRCLHGSLRPTSGCVRLDERALPTLSRREIARAIGVVPQQCPIVFPVSVRHFVALGRFAREPRFGGPSRADRACVARCLASMQIDALAERSVDELSGGEFRRVLIAQAMAQEPRILLLDEPVQQLDLRHQLEVMDFARAFSRRPGSAGLVALHDLGLAARYCDRVVVLHRGRVVADGPPTQALAPGLVSEVWGVRIAVERSAATGFLQLTPIGAGADSARAFVPPRGGLP